MRIIFEQLDGSLSIVIPAPDSGLTIEAVAAQAVPAGVPYRIVADDALPTDRTYRNAWEIASDQRTIVHNMDKAKTIHRDIMRSVRAERFKQLDVEYMRADERGPSGIADKQAIAAERQVLRDVTDHPGIDAATTPEELKQVWPVELGRNPFRQRGV